MIKLQLKNIPKENPDNIKKTKLNTSSDLKLVFF